MKKILDVVKVAFVGKTGDVRSPESFALPACMTSLMTAMGDDFGSITIHAHNKDWTYRIGNHQFLAATGMAFGLLWHDEMCMSAMDLTQVNPGYETIRRAFAWAGYEYSVVEKGDKDALSKVVTSIDAGAPVLIFNAFDPPECAIVAGYDGDVLIGWSHFQDYAKLETQPNGMFRAPDWQINFWSIILPGKKVGRSLTNDEIVRHGLSIMEKTKIDCYDAGFAAYEKWIDMLTTLPEDDESLKKCYEYHNSLLFNLAELRCWGGDFLRDVGEMDAAACFQGIHDMCWKADAVAGADKWVALKSPDKRAELVSVMNEIVALDKQAVKLLKEGI